MSELTMDKLVSLCKGRGFIFAGSEIYGGLANTWDYGPLGVELKNNTQARRGYMVYGHIHNNVRDDYWPLIARRSRMLNAGVDVNNFVPVTFDEMVENNSSFIARHSEEARQNPLSMFCLET